MDELTCDKVTRDALRAMPMNSSKTFLLPDANAILSAKTMATQMKHVLGCVFSVKSDFENNAITITKAERPPKEGVK